jgi:PAS domain-containing protein
VASRHLGWSAVLPRQARTAGPRSAESGGAGLLAALRHEDVAAALDDGLGVFDARGTGLECNAALRRLLGVPEPGLPDLTALQVLDESGQPLPLAATPFGLALSTGSPVSGTVLGFAPADDGAPTRWVRMAALPHEAADGSHRVVLTCTDVTAERDAVIALATAERRLRLTAEHAPIGIALVGTDGTLLDVNDALCRLLGSSCE